MAHCHASVSHDDHRWCSIQIIQMYPTGFIPHPHGPQSVSTGFQVTHSTRFSSYLSWLSFMKLLILEKPQMKFECLKGSVSFLRSSENPDSVYIQSWYKAHVSVTFPCWIETSISQCCVIELFVRDILLFCTDGFN